MMTTLLLSCLLLAPGLHAARWCYQSQYSCDDKCNGPGEWFRDFQLCRGQHQSPINIVTQKAKYDPSLTPVIFEGYTDIMNITVENNGYSAVFALPTSVRIRGGGLNTTYRALQFHLHWGSNGGLGSEHTVDGEQYPIELHILHMKEEYTTLNEAMIDPEGIAALAFFFEVSPEENQQFNKVIEALGRVRQNGTISVVPGFRLTDILVPLEQLSSYYRYLGSLTTPICDEDIIWTLFHQTIPISKRQLVLVTQQMLFPNGKPMTDIFRPLQNINGRVVYKSIANSCVSSAIILLMCLLCLLGLM